MTDLPGLVRDVASAKRERKRLHTGVEELDLKSSILDGAEVI